MLGVFRTNTAATCHEAHRLSTGGRIRQAGSGSRYTWCKDNARANADANSLAEEELVVFSRNAKHHEAKDLQKAAGHQQWLVKASIIKRPGHNAGCKD